MLLFVIRFHEPQYKIKNTQKTNGLVNDQETNYGLLIFCERLTDSWAADFRIAIMAM